MTTDPTNTDCPSMCRALCALAVFTAMSLSTTGCTTVESDMPWNAPPSWQGSPSIPGLNGDR
ncbi:MAG: hypothetical protein OSB41_00120 [Kiritimatiellae bacterium]|nr:hypothetical protein [Kiritimatiellia bacterium]